LSFLDKWKTYLAISYKIESDGRGADIAPEGEFTHYIDKMKNIMPPNKYPKLLDIGAAAGQETKALIDAGYHVVGITIGKDNIAYAEEKFGIKLLEMEMHDLHFCEGQFDGATVLHTFEHCFAPLIFLGELYFVLKDWARVFVVMPDPELEMTHTIWHTNLLPPEVTKYFWSYWGFKLLEFDDTMTTRKGWDKYLFVFDKLPKNHSEFKMWGYLQHIYNLRKKLGE